MSTNDRFTVGLTAQMLPAMLHGLALARNTAMLCDAPGVRKEFDRMLEALAEQAGVPNLLRSVDEYMWYQACEAMKAAKAYHWHTKEASRWSDEAKTKPGEVSLVVDDTEYALDQNLLDDNPHIQAIQELMERYASVDAVRGPPRSHWDSHRRLVASRLRERGLERARPESEHPVEANPDDEQAEPEGMRM